MTDNYRTQLKEWFDEADIDQKGTLSRFEVCKVLQKGGCKDETDEISGWFDEIDVNDDDALTFDELWLALNKRDPATVKESELRCVFQKIDADGSGYIDVEELKKQLAECGVEADVDAIVACTDCDGDGKVNCEEFLKGLRQSQ